MNALTASIARRSALLSVGFATTLAGHVLSGASLQILPVAPLLWVGLLAVFALATGHRAKPMFTAWSPTTTLGVLLVVQALSHLTLQYAPWALGFVGHSGHGAVTASAAVAHVAVALVLLAPLCWGQQLLERAAAVVRSIGRPRRRRVAPRPPRIIAFDQQCPATSSCAAPPPPRGPPMTYTPRTPRSLAPALTI